jgi:tetratricopeptide (TPR) repeat protein
LEEAQKINLEMSEVGNSPEVYISLARLEILKGNLIKAREYADQAISIVEDNDYYSWSRTRIIMGIIMQSMGNLHEAEQYFLEAVNKCKNSSFIYVSALSYLDYGRFLVQLKNIKLAESYLALALQNFEHIGAYKKIEDARGIIANLPPTH